MVKGQGAFVELTPKRKTRKSSFGILLINNFFFFLITKLGNILTKKGQVYKGKKNKKEMSRGTYTNHPKQK